VPEPIPASRASPYGPRSWSKTSAGLSKGNAVPQVLYGGRNLRQ